MEVTFIIPVRQNLPGLRTTLVSLEAQEDLQQTEVLVVNDGADPAISAFLQKLEITLPVREIAIANSRGSYHARNEGIRQAAAPYLIFLDDSMLLPPDWFSKLKPLLPRFAYIACEVQIKKNHRERLSEKYFRLTAFQTARYFHELHFGLTCCLAMQKQAFEQAGYFEDRIFSGGDREFGQRIHQQGLSQTYFDTATALHPSKNWRQQYRAQMRIYKGMQDLARLHPEQYRDLKLTPLQLLRNIYGFLLSVLFPQQHPLYQTGAFSFFGFVVVQFRSTWIYSKALVKVLMWREEEFNG